MDLYQDCSYDVPGVETGPAPGGQSSKHRNKEEKLQNSSSLKLESAEFGMKHFLVDLYQDCSYDAPGVKTGLARESQFQNIGTKMENFKILLF